MINKSNSLIKTETLDIEHTISGRLKELLDLKKRQDLQSINNQFSV